MRIARGAQPEGIFMPIDRALKLLGARGTLAVSAVLAVTGCLSGCSEPATGLSEMDKDGVPYELLDARVVAVNPEVTTPVTTPVYTREELSLPPLRTYSREDLAQMLRPTLVLTEGLYVESTPNFRAADAILADTGESVAVNVRRQFEPVKSDGDDEVVVATEDALVFGSESRSNIINTTATPYNVIVKLNMYRGATKHGSCTGTYIGPHTVLTAAHCLLLSDGTRINRIIFERAKNGTSFPYGSYDCRLDDASTTNNYTAKIAAGFVDVKQTPQLDFAVIRTDPCNGSAHYMGGYTINAAAATYNVYGYAGQCPGKPVGADYMCGMSGAGEVQDFRMESSEIDATEGESGAAWYRKTDINRVGAVYSGDVQYFDLLRCGFDLCRRNWGRRIDAALSDLIKATSPDY